MGTLIYATTVSLDGYVADSSGDFQWSAPTAQVFAAHLERMTEISMEILGRKTYELMRYWETDPDEESWSPDEQEFARRWRRIEKIAISSTLTSDDVATPRNSLLPTLDLTELQEIVRAAPGVVEIFGPTTAGPAIRAGLIDAFEFFVVPKTIGGGLRAIPEGTELDLRLADHQIFDDGTARMRYVRR